MVDTGAAPNLIKYNRLKPNAQIDKQNILRLTGITSGEVKTLGSVDTTMHGHPIEFHVVSEDFPIPQDGILGADFLSGKGRIDFVSQIIEWHDHSFPFTQREVIRLPARSRAVAHVRITNSGVSEGYVPRLPTSEGVYLGDAVVRNRSGRAYMYAINTTPEDVNLVVPSVELQPVDIVAKPPKSYNQREEFALGPDTPAFPRNVNNKIESQTNSNSHEEVALGLDAPVPPRNVINEIKSSINSISHEEVALGLDVPVPSRYINLESKSATNSNSHEETALGLETPVPSRKSISAAISAVNTAFSESRVSSQESLREPTLGLGEAGSSIESKDSHSFLRDANTKSGHERAKTVAKLLRLEHLGVEESQHVTRLIEKFSDIFHIPDDKLGHTNAMEHAINTTSDTPIHTKQYRFPPVHKQEIDTQVQALLENEVIKSSTSPYNSPLWIVPKKADSKGNKRWRMVIDYRALNEKTIGDAYPLPNITEILDQLGSAKYFSVFDLASGFHQIKMSTADAPKTAFSTPYGHYEFQRMPFGLKNAPATFQRLMDQVLTGLQGNELFVYLDDIVLYSSSLREHEIKFERLAARLRAANLKLQPDKCEFLRREVMYLGHIIGEDGVRPDPKKVEAVQKFPRPQTAKNIKQFLGLAGYYRRFIPGFSRIAKPLTELLKKEVTFHWDSEQNDAFGTLRDALCSEPLLQYPDFTKPFVVTTDASQTAIGAILSQGKIGKDLPIAYTSRLLNDAEQNYSTIERELLAIVYAVNHFRPYLFGRKFVLVTDHKPLVWINSVKDPTSRLVRWRLKLAEYDYEVIYKAGKTNVNADALSRNPVANINQILPISSDGSIFNATPPCSTTPSHLNALVTQDAPPLYRDMSSDTSPSPLDPSLSQELTPHDASPAPNATPNVTGDIPITEIVNDNFTDENFTENYSSDTINSDSDSGSESDEPMFDPVIEQSRPRRANVTESRDNITTKRDNIVIFTTDRGEPCDEGSRLLREADALPTIRDGMIGRVKVNKTGKKYLIALILEKRISEASQLINLKESIASLRDAVDELQLKSFAISKSLVIDVSWNQIQSLILRHFCDSNVKITVCSNEVTVPPEAARLEVIRENHDTPIGGHKGVTKTIERIRYKYQWPRLRADVERYVKTCRECQLKKLVRLKTRQPMILTDTPGTAFEKISMDIMGPLPISKNGFTYILTIQDLLTKFSLAIPLRQATSVAIADAFISELICVFGAPRIILTDQGSNFTSSLLKNVARRFKVRQIKTTAYRPQSNGSVERSHQVLWEYLKQFARKDNWDEYLRLATFSSNTSVHEGTRYTPYELVFGKIAEVPSDEPARTPDVNETYTQYLTTLFDKLRDTQRAARENLRSAKIRSKRYYDKKTRPREFNTGDKVYLLREPLKSKLDGQYTGPYKIAEMLPNNNARLEVTQGHYRVVHTDKLKLAHLDAPTPRNDSVTPSETTTPQEGPGSNAAISDATSSVSTRSDAQS